MGPVGQAVKKVGYLRAVWFYKLNEQWQIQRVKSFSFLQVC